MKEAEKVTYKLLDENNIEDYKKLRTECLQTFPDNFGTTYQEELTTDFPLSNTIRKSDNNKFVLGAFLNEFELVGILGFVQELRLKTRHRGELVQMYVSPKHNGKGIGRQLLKLTIQKAFENPEIKQIVLGVTEINIRAKQLYEEIGFKEYGKLENYFKTENKSIAQCFMCLNKTDYNN